MAVIAVAVEAVAISRLDSPAGVDVVAEALVVVVSNVPVSTIFIECTLNVAAFTIVVKGHGMGSRDLEVIRERPRGELVVNVLASIAVVTGPSSIGKVGGACVGGRVGVGLDSLTMGLGLDLTGLGRHFRRLADRCLKGGFDRRRAGRHRTDGRSSCDRDEGEASNRLHCEVDEMMKVKMSGLLLLF